MGVEWSVACEERKEMFELGKGPWEKLGDLIAQAAVDPFDNVNFVRRFMDLVRPGKANFELGYATRVGTRLWEWCEERDWKVKVVNDAIGDFCYEMTVGWMITGSRFEPKPVTAPEPKPVTKNLGDALPAINYLRSIVDSLTEKAPMDALLARCILELDDRLKRVEAHVPRPMGLFRLAEPYETPDIDVGVSVKGRSEGEGLILKTIKSRPRTSTESPIFDFEPSGTLCSVCGEPQYETPGGPVCKHGHGGAPPKEE